MIFSSLLRPVSCRFSALLVTLALLPCGAEAATLPQLTEKCFVYTAGTEIKSPHKLASTGFRAELAGTGYVLTVKSLSLVDQNNALSADALSRINAAAAYGVLTTALHGISPQCKGQPLPEIDEIKNSRPDARWRGLVLNVKDHKPFSLENVHISVTSTSPAIHALATVSGIKKPDVPLTPDNVTVDMAFMPAPEPPFQITLNDIQAHFGVSTVRARGNVLAASNIEDSKAEVHLSISEIGKLIATISKVAPPKMTTALLLARLFGHRENEHVTGWEIVLDHAKIRVNGIPVPFALH